MSGQLELTLGAAPRAPLNVSQLVRAVREALEANLDEFWVVGEVSNARLAPSNHFYFTLKDARCAISVVMFASAFRRLRFRVDDGMEVVIRGHVNLYEARGALQFYAEEMEPRGVGALQIAFEQLKQRLGREGLFAQAAKRRLPFLPRTIGIVTALGSAALRDMLRILFDRYPNLRLIIRSARVQGAGAESEVAAAIDDLNEDGRAEVIIIGRGGGSLEDLWAFNEESVARAIRRSGIPIVSAVGHEIDYTIADFVADARAPTPTAAAQMVIPDKAELARCVQETAATLAGAAAGVISGERKQLAHLAVRLHDPRGLIRQRRQQADEAAGKLASAVESHLGTSRRHLGELKARLRSPLALVRERRLETSRLELRLAQAMRVQVGPRRLAIVELAPRLAEANLRAAVATRRERCQMLAGRLNSSIASAIGSARSRLSGAMQRLDDVSPLRVLERGYAVVINRRDGRAVVAADSVEIADELDLKLRRGRLAARVIAREN